MQKKQQKSKKNQEGFLAWGNIHRKELIVGSIIGTIIAITPYLFYLYESVPTTRVWNTFLFSYDSKEWNDANFAMWVFTSKAIPLLLLLIWFFTNRHWWYHVLLVPIIMYAYQISVIFNDDARFIDEYQIIYLIPIMAFVIPSIYLIRARIFDRINDANKSFEELEEEFKIKPKSLLDKINQYF